MGNRNLTNDHVWDDILQIWFSGYLEIVSDMRRNQISPDSIFDKFLVISKEFLKSFLFLFIERKIPKHKVWFLSISTNNYHALKLIKEGVNDSIFVSPLEFSKTNNNSYELNLKYKFFYHLIFFVNLFLFRKQSKQKTKMIDLLFKSNGSYSECKRIIKKYKPKAIVFSNDHEILPRALLLAANKLSIKTFYVQHASVSEYFPCLDFTYSLLEGEDSKVKYLRESLSKSKVELIGMPKFDPYSSKINKSKFVKTIGIAYNANDDLDIIKALIHEIKNTFNDIKIIKRAHPSDQRKFNISKVETSNSSVENSFEFLQKIDAMIASDSSIHLEATMFNVYSMSYNFNYSSFLDYYGFVNNNLINHYNSSDELIKAIKTIKNNKPNVQKKAKYYNAAIDSSFYGNSALKAQKLIINSI